MKSRYLGSMASAVLLSATIAPQKSERSERYYADEPRSSSWPKPKLPPRNDEMHIKAAAEKRARKALKFRKIQERQAREKRGEGASDLVVVSLDERGFYHADFYMDGQNYPLSHWEDVIISDGFATTKIGASKEDAKNLAEKYWPGVKIDFSALRE